MTAASAGAQQSATRLPLAYRLLVAAVAATHLAVSLFMVLGGLLVWAGLAPIWLQVPLAAWGVVVFVGNMTCPLTPLEKALRQRAGLPVYHTGFVEQYLMPPTMRGRVTSRGNVMLGLGVLAVNLAIYGAMLASR